MQNNRITDLVFASLAILLIVMNSAGAISHIAKGEYVQGTFNAVLALLWLCLYFAYARQLFRRDERERLTGEAALVYVRKIDEKIDAIEYLQSEVMKLSPLPAVCLDSEGREIKAGDVLLCGEQTLEVREVGFRAARVWSVSHEGSEDLGWHMQNELEKKGARVLVKEE